MKTILVVLFDDVLLLDVVGPIEVFSLANRFLAEDQRYRISTVSERQGSITASNGMRIQTDWCLDDAPTSGHYLLIPGGPGAYQQAPPERLQAWLRQTAAEVAVLGSICTGAFVLAQAGLLDGYRVTTHWNYTERLAQRFPSLSVEADHIVLRDRAFISSGGITAGIDLALTLVAETHGQRIATEVAKTMVVSLPRQTNQRLFSPLIQQHGAASPAVSAAYDAMVERLHEPLTIERLASAAAMSARHFARVFVRETGLTPMEYLKRVRIDHARTQLESTTLPLKAIAHGAGFGTVRTMRQAFIEKLGVSPNQYRKQFT